jgi:hypothetical protein
MLFKQNSAKLAGQKLTGIEFFVDMGGKVAGLRDSFYFNLNSGKKE